MNNTSEQIDGDQSDQREATVGPYAYTIGIFLGVIIFLIVITYTYYIYARNHHNPVVVGGGRNSINNTNISTTDESPHHESVGLDEATIHSYPKLPFSKVKEFEGDNRSCDSSGCSICLQDYKDVDLLRILSECGHFFHQKCVDPWLRIHPTCPVCRNFPVTTASDTSAPAVTTGPETFVQRLQL